MAKKSAKSKGYRKTVKKKPFLTKKELIELVVIVAVIALGVVLFNLFYDDGFIRSSEVQPGDVVATASREAQSRYAKVAVANELDGFTRSDPDPDTNPAAAYVYTPDAETDSIENIRVSGSYIAAEQLAQNIQAQMSSLVDTFEATPQLTTTVQGHDAYIFSYTVDYYEAPEGEDAAAEEEAPAEGEAPEEETPPSNNFSQTLCCYVDVDGYTLCFGIYRTGEDDSFYLPEDQIEEYLLKYADAFTIVDRKA